MATNYLYISPDNILDEIIPDEDSTFPGIPASQRYSEEFLAACIIRSDEQLESEGIKTGMTYDAETDSFYMAYDPGMPQYYISETEISKAYMEGVNNVE